MSSSSNLLIRTPNGAGYHAYSHSKIAFNAARMKAYPRLEILANIS